MIERIQIENVRKREKPIQTIDEYLMSSMAYWFWATIALTIGGTIAVLTIPGDFYPLVYARYMLAVLFTLWMPGYTFTKALFPTSVPDKLSESIDIVERTALSFGMSLVLVPIVGLLLNYTPWGIRLTPLSLSLLTLTLVLSLSGMLRDYQARCSATEIQKEPVGV